MKLKASKNEAGKADDKTLLSELTRENSYQLFSQWLESTKKSAKIEKNIQAIQGR